MPLIILGNGFDLSLGLKTSYTNFIDSSLVQNKKTTNELYQHLIKQRTIFNWIDLEMELIVYSGEGVKNSKKTFSDFETPKSRFSNFTNKFKEDYNELKNDLTEYLHNETNSFNANQRYENLYKKLGVVDGVFDMLNIEILTFNYTKCVEDVFYNLIAPERIKYLHGNLVERNIILGINEQDIIPIEHSFLLKANPINFGKVDIKKLLANNKHIVFFGYSFGETDFDYFDDFFNSLYSKENNYKVDIYYLDTKKTDGKIVKTTEYLDSINANLRKLTNNNLGKLKLNANVNFIETSTLNSYK